MINTQVLQRLEAYAADSRARNQLLPAYRYFPLDKVDWLIEQLKTELAVNALLSEALEKIREENKRYANTAVMDWDGVQEFASQALEAAQKLRSGK